MDFNRNAHHLNGLSSYCRDCDRIKRAERRGKVHRNHTQLHRDQIELECHLCVFIEALERQEKTAQIEADLRVLGDTLNVFRRNYHLVSPNYYWLKEFILKALTDAPVPLSLDEIMEAAARDGRLLDRRRLHIRLAGMKRKKEVVNVAHGFWTVFDRLHSNFDNYKGPLDWASRSRGRSRSNGGRIEYRCSHCKKYFPASNFHKNQANSDGLYWYCKSCWSALQKIWREQRLQ